MSQNKGEFSPFLMLCSLWKRTGLLSYGCACHLGFFVVPLADTVLETMTSEKNVEKQIRMFLLCFCWLLRHEGSSIIHAYKHANDIHDFFLYFRN